MDRFLKILAALLAAALSACSSGSGNAQIGQDALLFVSAGTSQQVLGRDVATYPDGSTLVTAEFTDSIVVAKGQPEETTLSAIGASWNMLAAKYDPTGKLVWARRASTNDGNGVDAIALPDGSAIVTGTMLGSTDFGSGETNETTFDTGGVYWSYIARLGPDGNLAWVKALQGPRIRDIAPLPNSSLVVCGYFDSASTFGAGEATETTITPTARRDIFVANYDTDGNFFWVKRTMGATGSDQSAEAIASAPDGSFAITGYVNTSCTFGPGEANGTTLTTSGGYENPFLARFHADGSLNWARSVPSDNHMNAFAVAASSDGSCTIAGRLTATGGVFGQGETNETTLLGPGLFLAHYAPTGDLAWAKGLTSPQQFDQEGDVAAMPDGSLVVTGTFYMEADVAVGELNETVLQASQGAFLARYAADGRLVWASSEAAADSPMGKAVAANTGGTFAWVGNCSAEQGLMLGGTAILPAQNYAALWVARVGE